MSIRFSGFLLLFIGPTLLQGGEWVLVEQSQPRIVIHAPGENEWAGKRLAQRLNTWTGATVAVHLGEQPPDAPEGLVVVGTPTTNSIAGELLAGDAQVAQLGDEGYLLRTSRWHDRDVLLLSGQTLAGVQHAVSELVSWKLRLGPGQAVIPQPLDEWDRPRLGYRIVWTWDGHCNWAPTFDEAMALYVNGDPALGSMAVPYTADGFRSHMTRAIDYLSDHKLNGLIVWGFLRDDHGGVEMGREISRYAKQNNVRILPGVCSQGGYGGFIFSSTNIYNLDVWTAQHPELRAKNAQGEFVNGMLNPLSEENQQWLRDGAEWLFTELPDIGGINLENGDFFSCHCEECLTARALPENDPNCFWDMQVTQTPILEVAQSLRPDGWMTFATYTGFTEERARLAGPQAVYPPRFLNQMPENGICQWTFTGMTTPDSWPAGARSPESNFQAEIGLLHHGSVWGSPMDADRWWGAPGAWNDDYSQLLPFICSRTADANLGGLVITGQSGDQCPAHELNYIAMEYFTWHPERTYEQFHQDRLVPCYGGDERAALFLQLLNNTTRDPLVIDAASAQARTISEAADLDVRQRARWLNLAEELAYRAQLAQAISQQDPSQ